MNDGLTHKEYTAKFHLYDN